MIPCHKLNTTDLAETTQPSTLGYLKNRLRRQCQVTALRDEVNRLQRSVNCRLKGCGTTIGVRHSNPLILKPSCCGG